MGTIIELVYKKRETLGNGLDRNFERRTPKQYSTNNGGQDVTTGFYYTVLIKFSIKNAF